MEAKKIRFAVPPSCMPISVLADLEELIRRSECQGDYSTLTIEYYEDDEEDDIEKDGNFPSRSRKQPSKLKRINKPMLLASPHSPDETAGVCMLLDDKETKILEFTSGDRYLNVSKEEVDMPVMIDSPDEQGQFRRETHGDGKWMHNCSNPPEYIVMIITDPKPAYVTALSKDDITKRQDSKQGVFPLISMWKTTRVNDKGMDTSLYFNIRHSDESYNYYLVPNIQEPSQPEAKITLTKVCVTGYSDQELADLNFKYIYFNVKVGGDAVDAGLGMESDGDFSAEPPKKPICTSVASQQVTRIKETNALERPDSGLGSLCASMQEL